MTTATRRYPSAPITEAVIDIRVQLPLKVALSDLERLGVQIPEYPTRRSRTDTNVSIDVDKTTTTNKNVGFIFNSTDDKQLVQFRFDGFTFSRLKPYDRWTTFSSEARRLWAIYKAGVNPTKIERLAVRYINRIDMPKPVDLAKYLKTLPEVSADLCGKASNFFFQLHVDQDDLHSTLLFNEAIVPPSNPSVVSALLDFDLFRTVDLPENDDAIWEIFEQFRNRKNQLFEACITDDARRLFDA